MAADSTARTTAREYASPLVAIRLRKLAVGAMRCMRRRKRRSLNSRKSLKLPRAVIVAGETRVEVALKARGPDTKMRGTREAAASAQPRSRRK